MNRWFFIRMSVLLVVYCTSTPAEMIKHDNPQWEVIEDEVYLQEIPTIIPTDLPLTSVAVFNGEAYAGSKEGVSIVEGDTLVLQDAPVGSVQHLIVLDESLWGITDTGLWRFDGNDLTQISDQPITDICEHNGQMVVLMNKSLCTVEGNTLSLLTDKGVGNAQQVESYSGAIYVHDGKRIGFMELGSITYNYTADWGTIESGATINDMMAMGSRLYFATDEGLSVLRGMTWYNIQGEEGLPYEDTTSLCKGFDRDLWIGTARGTIRNINDEYQYFNHQRYLPNDKVNAVACGDNVTYMATEGGLGIIHYEPYTLAKKAAYYERWLEEWGMKRLGFVHILFEKEGEWLREVSDNDVGYSSHYLAAKCFEYAVTGSEEARAEAVDMMKTVKWSEEISSIKGYPARSIYASNERTIKADHGSGGLPAEWHATPDGQWEWKGDTSSDETDAHVYETMIFLQLVANDEERVWATEHLNRVIGHIVDNGFLLRDVDGEPSRWGRWDPDYLFTPYGQYAQGLNGLEIMNYVTTAYHFTQNPKFQKAKDELIELGYHKNIVRQKLTFHPGFFTRFDDRLAFYNFYSIGQYETDPQLKALWLRSLERSWEVKRIDGTPWFNFIYGAITGNDCEMDRSVAHLREWPLDLRRYSYQNGHRADLHTPPGYRMYSERAKPLSPRETEPNRWDGDFMRLDGTYGGKIVSDPSGWLDAYWMGRYHGMITAPKTDDPSLTTVPDRGLKFGAEPYVGPARPKLKHER